MARLPIPGSDDGKWGQILNEYLSQSHDATGKIKSGAVTKSDVGLSNVDNTSDANKPVSAATQTALSAKISTTALDAQMASKIQSDGSATADALSASFARIGVDGIFVDVTTSPYSAKGDGTTNDTVAIQAAIDAVSAAGGGTVFFPQGTYIATRITLKSRVALVGASWLSTILKLRTGTNADFIVLENVNTEQVALSSIRVNGNRAGNSSGTAIKIDNTAGTYTYSDPYHLFQNVFVENAASDGWYISTGVRESRFLNCHSKLAYNNGFRIAGTDNFFTDCTAATSGRIGWYVEGGNNQFVSCKAFSSGQRMAVAGDFGDGFYITYAPRNKFVGCEAQDNLRYGFVLIGNACFSNTLVACIADSNAVFPGTTFAGFMIDNLAQRNFLVGCISGNQHTTQDYGLIIQGGAFGNELDIKIDSQGTAEHYYVGTAATDNQIRINGVSAQQVREALATGQETFSRRYINNASISSGASGRMALTYFTARTTETITQVRMMSAGTAASGTILARIGIYSVATNGDLTLVASTANDTALFSTTFATYTKALSASLGLVAGQRYAVGLLVVATTMPFVYGTSTAFGAEAVLAPRLGGTLSGQTDLPTTVTNASLSATNANLQPYAALLP